ncbi:hypothetical protein [Aliivibrio fischeri]|uniref:hypothetical protein n=1 Tax=Aliivibrio fischeri TaxID=668 RepID=UPI0007C49BE6|nr:hypothetical protein [Aliivibrio fischeri]
MNQSKRTIISALKLLESQLESCIDNADKIKSDAETLLVRAEQMHFKYGEAYSKLIISLAYWHLMQYPIGFKIARELLHMHQELEDDDLLPKILHVLASHSWGQAKLFSAQQFWIQALEQASLLGDNEIEIEALIGLGNIWRMTNNLNDANFAHNIAAQRAKFYRIPHLEAKAYILQAWDNYLLGNYQEMLPILIKSEELLVHHSNLTWKAEIYDFRGLAFLGLNDLNLAQQSCSYAYQLAQQHQLTWMMAHSSISLARVASAQSHYLPAYELLTEAELIAEQFDKGELRSQICLEQSRIAELTKDYEHALYSYKRYRQYEIALLQEQSNSLGRDKSNSSKEQLDSRARKLINRIQLQLELNSISALIYLQPFNKWAQHLSSVYNSNDLKNHYVISIIENSEEKLDTITSLIHHYCRHGDLLTRKGDNEVLLLLNDSKEKCDDICRSLSSLFTTYPWQRYSFEASSPMINYFTITEYFATVRPSQTPMEI